MVTTCRGGSAGEGGAAGGVWGGQVRPRAARERCTTNPTRVFQYKTKKYAGCLWLLPGRRGGVGGGAGRCWEGGAPGLFRGRRVGQFLVSLVPAGARRMAPVAMDALLFSVGGDWEARRGL